jgi:ribosomal protein L21E
MNVGDKVRILAKASTYWVPAMDKTIGKVGVVVCVRENSVAVKVDDRNTWFYPLTTVRLVINDKRTITKFRRNIV